jgi:hypothetical protein
MVRVSGDRVGLVELMGDILSNSWGTYCPQARCKPADKTAFLFKTAVVLVCLCGFVCSVFKTAVVIVCVGLFVLCSVCVDKTAVVLVCVGLFVLCSADKTAVVLVCVGLFVLRFVCVLFVCVLFVVLVFCLLCVLSCPILMYFYIIS